ncbi:helix-turn-helix domain-containing protein [Dysgonomonas reticulitermitis]
MLFAKKIKQLREELQMPQRQLAAALEIDTPMYSKIERGERPAKRKQIPIIAELLKTDENELVTLWVADKIIAVVGKEKEFTGKAFKIAQQEISKE